MPSFFDDDTGTEVIPLVTCGEHGSYQVHDAAVAWLSTLEGPLGVLTCAGKYRTGKSYLMNRLCGATRRDDVFKVGETVQACTKGIWMLKRVFAGESCQYIVLDTEGIDALDADSTHDVKIFTLALLLSSLFIYNSVGAIDESSLQTLSLVTKVSECVRADRGGEAAVAVAVAGAEAGAEGEAAGAAAVGAEPTGAAATGAETAALAEFFPHFAWVLRDFTLRLVDEHGAAQSDAAYLESALADRPGASADRGAVRRAIRSAFPRRTLFTLPRPAADEHLARIASNPGRVHKAFNSKVTELREWVGSSIRPMAAGPVAMSGAMYAKLCEHLARGVSEGGSVPVVRDAWCLMSEVRARESATRARAAMDEALQADAAEDGGALGSWLPRMQATARALIAAFDREQLQEEAEARVALEAALAERVARGLAAARARRAAAVAAQLAHVDAALERALQPPATGAVVAAMGCPVHAALQGVLVHSLTEARGLVERAGEGAESAEGGQALGAWAVDALDRLLGGWLPRVAAFAETHSRRVGDLDDALRVARAEADHAQDAANGASANRAEAELAMLQARHAAVELEEERERSAEWQRRMVELHSELEVARAGAAATTAAAAVEAGSGEAHPSAAVECEAATVATAMAAVEVELRHESELQIAHDQSERYREACVGLERQLASIQGTEETQAAQWDLALRDLRECNEVTLADLRDRARQTELDAQRDRDDQAARSTRLAVEVTALRDACGAADSRLESVLAAATRDDQRAAGREARLRAATEEMQQRLLEVHTTSLQETRERDTRQRTDQERHLAVVMELQSKCSVALADAEQQRTAREALKRRADDAIDLEREGKRLRVAIASGEARLLRAQAEADGLRRRAQELARERDEARAAQLLSERDAAASKRELDIERARLAGRQGSGHGGLARNAG
jgi:hypothetical protein